MIANIAALVQSGAALVALYFAYRTVKLSVDERKEADKRAGLRTLTLMYKMQHLARSAAGAAFAADLGQKEPINRVIESLHSIDPTSLTEPDAVTILFAIQQQAQVVLTESDMARDGAVRALHTIEEELGRMIAAMGAHKG